MDLSLLETLRHKIVTGKVFSDVFEYFFDHFGEKMEFFDEGEPAKDELLLNLLGQIGGAIFKTEKVTLDRLCLMRIEKYNFIHGGMTMNGAVANVIYCDDLQKGILAVHRPKMNPPTQFARFSAEMLAPNLVAESSNFKH